MSTYGAKVEEYRARLEALLERGLEPDEKDIGKLRYYVDRAVKQGLDHQLRFLDAVQSAEVKVERNAARALEAVAREAIEAANALLGDKRGH